MSVPYAGLRQPDNSPCHRIIVYDKVVFAYLYISTNKHINITMSFASSQFDAKD